MSKTILAVEPSSDVRRMLDQALTEAGFHVVHAADGAEGLKMLEAGGPAVDVIITDIDAPSVDDAGFIATVRNDGLHGATPILILAGDHDALRKDRARRAGASGWMLKPFNAVKLIDAVRRVAA